MISACGTVMQVGPQGRAFDLLRPERAAVRLADIVPALSKLCRFNGHCRVFFSVAQHCILVSELCPPHLAIEGLLHDAAEAYLGDQVSPMKAAVHRRLGDKLGWHDYRQLLDRVESTVAEALGATWPMPAAVKHADLVACSIEREYLLPDSADVGWNLPPAPPHALVPLNPDEAERAFWARYHALVPA